jgi:uncharacterized membrane protein YccC
MWPDSTSTAEKPVIEAASTQQSKPSPWQAYWRSVLHFDARKMKPWVAFRNALGATAPLAVWLALNKPHEGLAVCLGALQVAYSDGDDSYRDRAQRMLMASVLGALAVVIGGLIGGRRISAELVIALCAFAAGLVVALGENAGTQGLISLVTLIIYAAQPLSVRTSVVFGLLALAGGIFQTFLSLLFWPLRRLAPERRALGALYLDLSQLAMRRVRSEDAPPLTAESTYAQQVVGRLQGDYTPAGERFWSLLNQAERVRLGLLALGRLQKRLQRTDDGQVLAADVNGFLNSAGSVLESTGYILSGRSARADLKSELRLLEHQSESLRSRLAGMSPNFVAALVRDAVWQMDALAGQLRAACRLAQQSIEEADHRLQITVRRIQPWVGVRADLSRIRANLTLRSSAFRHAMRMAVCVAGAEALAPHITGRRSYWLPMTVVLVLKPEFAATFSRGLLRILGTIIGLLLATVMFHFIRATVGLEVLLIGVFVFALRWAGAANYGVFTIAVSGVVVLMVAYTGVEPSSVILARGLMTVGGGAIALAAYAVWPTWERTRVSETLARLLDVYGRYFACVLKVRLHPRDGDDERANETRQAARLARTMAEASLDRLRMEPGTPPEQVRFLSAAMASSNRFVHAAMAAEVSPPSHLEAQQRDAFERFASDVQSTMAMLARILRGDRASKRAFPDLREAYRVIVTRVPQEEHSQVVEECDRIVNSVNTLRELIVRWMASQQASMKQEKAARVIGG